MENKRRTPNFSKYEIDVLLELVGANASVLENKKTDGCSLKEKQAMWSHMEAQFNSTPGVTKRSCDRLKTCYENMKRRLRKDLAEEKVEVYKTGGGKPTQKTTIHDRAKLLEIVGSSMKPLKNAYDSDAQFSMIVDVVNMESCEVQCSENMPPASVVELAECTQPSTSHSPVVLLSKETPNNVLADVTQLQSVSQSPDQPNKNICTPKNTWNRRRMPAKPRPSGSGTVIDNVCKKRVELLEAQLLMMKAEHQKELRIKNLKILALKEKLQYWKKKNASDT
ncbi:myb/SANT-like DNA-binding domain-containing protein 3 [Schistocerca americana]|uniref:myb/SANT-like DNA-binding domain-containing protein 3 n=1 Tax=Schistocerca americana TaxID=7009 RepID=UPI001F501C53|nr:myb/SANT-like DNA-binding domain-containing protein 3 [Schistocerca americana]